MSHVTPLSSIPGSRMSGTALDGLTASYTEATVGRGDHSAGSGAAEKARAMSDSVQYDPLNLQIRASKLGVVVDGIRQRLVRGMSDVTQLLAHAASVRASVSGSSSATNPAPNEHNARSHLLVQVRIIYLP